MLNHFKSISLTHEQASVDIREQFYLPEKECRLMLKALKTVLGLEDAFVLSTCNRTEIYFISEEHTPIEVLKLLCLVKGISCNDRIEGYFTFCEDHHKTVNQLFEVAMGLHSKVLGDLQISNQIKNAYSWANEEKLAGPFLHRLMHTIFHANKRVQQETSWRDGAASVSYAAVELVKDLVYQHQSPSVLVAGMGEMGRDVARNLKGSNFTRIAVTNRTEGTAKQIAEEIQAELIPFEEFTNAANDFDVVICAFGSEKPILEPGHFHNLDRFRQKYLVDLSVPRGIAKAVSELPGVMIYDIDEIKGGTNEVLAKRKNAIPQVKTIIDFELANFHDWSKELSISPTIQKLKEALDEIRRDEVAKHIRNLSEKEAEIFDQATKNMMNKIIKLPVLQLKAACKRGEEETLIDVLNDLFNLEEVKEEA